jgi:hypothetical protein
VSVARDTAQLAFWWRLNSAPTGARAATVDAKAAASGFHGAFGARLYHP